MYIYIYTHIYTYIYIYGHIEVWAINNQSDSSRIGSEIKQKPMKNQSKINRKSIEKQPKWILEPSWRRFGGSV